MPSINVIDYRHLYKIIRRKNISAKVILENKEGDILLVKSPEKAFWSLPGGICEMHEAPTHAAIREIKEELGITLQHPKLAAIAYTGSGDIDGVTFFFYGDRLHANMVQRIKLQSDEISEFRMLPLSDALALVKPETKKTLLRILQGKQRRLSYVEYSTGHVSRESEP